MKKTLIKLTLLLTCILGSTISSYADSPKEFLSGNISKLENGALVPFELNPNVKYIAVYYSAHWCPPCRKMTPILVKFYNELSAADKEKVEFVFYSWDNSESEMKEYMSTYSMKWPAVALDSELLKHYNEGRGIPSLVLLDAETGEVISDSYVGDSYRGPISVVQELMELLKK